MAKAPDERALTIPPLHMMEVEITIVGTTPLIQNQFSEWARIAMEEAQSGAAKTKKAPREPIKEFRGAIYRTPDGRYAHPAGAIKEAMVAAGFRFAGETGTKLRGAFSIPAELLAVEMPDGTPEPQEEPDPDGWPRMRTDRVVLSGASRTTSIAYRPEFSPWEMTVPVLFNAGFITLDQIVNLLRLAGFSVGIGAWRVEKKGIYGQFAIDGNRIHVVRDEKVV